METKSNISAEDAVAARRGQQESFWEKRKSEFRSCPQCSMEIPNPFIERCPRCFARLPRLKVDCTGCLHKRVCPVVK